MRRIGVCEERGSGYDKVVFQTELYQLPAPEIDIYNDHTKVILYAHKDFSKMSKDDKYRACYLHACLKRVNREYMTNSSLRERFKIDPKNSSMISRLLNDTCAIGLIRISDDSTSDKNRKYVPFWAYILLDCYLTIWGWNSVKPLKYMDPPTCFYLIAT